MKDNYENSLRETQLSGRRGIATDFGSHVVNLFFWQCKQTGVSAGGLFIDVVAAFYSVIRQVVVDMGQSDEHVATLLKNLQLGPDVMHKIYDSVGKGSFMHREGFSEHTEAIVG